MVLFFVSGSYSIRSHNFFLSNSVHNVNCFNTHQKVCFHALVKVVLKKTTIILNLLAHEVSMKLILKLKRQSYFSICVKLFFSIKHHIFYFIFFLEMRYDNILQQFMPSTEWYEPLLTWQFLYEKKIYMCRDSTIKFCSYIFNTNYIIKQ